MRGTGQRDQPSRSCRVRSAAFAGFRAALLARLGFAVPGLAAIFVTVFACESDAASPAEQRRKMFAAVKSWGIHLRYMDKRQIAASPFDLVVVDYAPYRHLTFEFPYERPEVVDMQRKPDGRRRLVLAYLSIGEVEDYRSYWRREWDVPANRPAWIGNENPKWPGNYPARFWDADWQRLLFGTPASYLDRIIAAGFDGVYLDRADVFEEMKLERPSAEADMTRLIEKLSRHARSVVPEFLVVLQNAEELLDKRPVRASIDGFAKEDLLFGAEAQEQANPADMVAHSMKLLRRARRSGLPILVLEYLNDPAKTAEARRRIVAEGFLPHFAERSLNYLTMKAPDEPGDWVPPPLPRKPTFDGGLISERQREAPPTDAATPPR